MYLSQSQSLKVHVNLLIPFISVSNFKHGREATVSLSLGLWGREECGGGGGGGGGARPP